MRKRIPLPIPEHITYRKKKRDFTIELSNHCVEEIMAQGFTFDEMLQALNWASYHEFIEIDLERMATPTKILRVIGLKGRIILNPERSVGITFLSDSGRKRAVHQYKYAARYKSTFNLARVFNDGDYMRLHKHGNRITIMRDNRAMGYMDVVYDSGRQREWTTALGKVYPSKIMGNEWMIDVLGSTDRNGSRLLIRDQQTSNMSCGKLTTKEDNDYRKDNPEKYNF